MKRTSTIATVMPDIATHSRPHRDGALDWVGMRGVQSLAWFDPGDGQPQRAAARVDAFVNLWRADSRGIHMSRLYVLLDRHLGNEAIGPSMLEALLAALIESHEGLSLAARVAIHFELLLRRPALRSGLSGWRAYPITVDAVLDAGGLQLEWSTEVVYSSTCPASAALARQLIQQQFASDFDPREPIDHASVLAWLGSEQGVLATPHAQRSVAKVQVRFARQAKANLIGLLDHIEQSLGTPVQTAVKREDEQAFSLANGNNLMFCEDAARRIQSALDADDNIQAFRIRVEHQESLHAHDAVAYASRSTRDGLPRV